MLLYAPIFALFLSFSLILPVFILFNKPKYFPSPSYITSTNSSKSASFLSLSYANMIVLDG